MIGGSPSTGSSVLVNLLNRRPELLAGPETYLFIHPRLYSDWPAYRRYLLNHSKTGGLKSIGWFAINGALLLDPFYGWEPLKLKGLVEDSGDFSSFCGSFFSPAMAKKGATRWVEKSPSNALCMEEFLQYFPTGLAIHTTRDPYDTVASLVSRGLSPFQAAASYLVNTAFALKMEGQERYHRIRYEDWVADPGQYLGKCFRFLGLDWDPNILEPPEDEKEVRMKGWLQSEKGKLGASSLGRFHKMEEGVRDRIRYAIFSIRLRDGYRLKHELPVSSIRQICDMLDYPFQAPGPVYYGELALEKYRDLFHRLRRFYPIYGSKYPVEILSHEVIESVKRIDL